MQLIEHEHVRPLPVASMHRIILAVSKPLYENSDYLGHNYEPMTDDRGLIAGVFAVNGDVWPLPSEYAHCCHDLPDFSSSQTSVYISQRRCP